MIAAMENVIRDYGKEELEKIKKNLMVRMEKRYQLETEKMKTVLTAEIHKYIKDPNKGFLFAEAVVNLLLAKLELYQKKYYKETGRPGPLFHRRHGEARGNGRTEGRIGSQAYRGPARHGPV